MTDIIDNDPAMPDALETAARLDAEFARTGKLVGPLHGVVMAVKDQYDTFDLRTTSGADAFYANDRPPTDAEFVRRLRAAGAIILAKANLSEYAGGVARSSFGGTFVNPYDTERSPGLSSAGSATSVAANLVTCAIAEETVSSLRGPAQANSTVGIAPTQELVSRHGMIQMSIRTRVGPIARTVEDAARVLTVIAGYDAKDPLTAFCVGRLPGQPYETFTHESSLQGLRIGVVREYMNKKLFSKADEETIDLVNRAIDELRELGATIVDPGPEGELFTDYIGRLYPMLMNAAYSRLYPDIFPVDAQGMPVGDHIATLVEIAADPARAPAKITLRDLGHPRGAGAGARGGEGRFSMNLYLRQRGDANIKTRVDLSTKANFFDDPQFSNRKAPLEYRDKARVLDTAILMQRRFAVQQIVLQAFADLEIDALVYPTGNLPPGKIGQPAEPAVNGRTFAWGFLGEQGFPAMTVPAGFTTRVYDRVRDPKVPPLSGDRRGRGYGGPAEPSLSQGPVPASLPVGMDIVGRPFGEPTLLRIAAAFEKATRHRAPPPDFGPLPSEP